MLMDLNGDYMITGMLPRTLHKIWTQRWRFIPMRAAQWHFEAKKAQIGHYVMM